MNFLSVEEFKTITGATEIKFIKNLDTDKQNGGNVILINDK